MLNGSTPGTQNALHAYGTRPWRIHHSLWDQTLLRNNPLYLVEGTGGLNLLLGESTAKIQQILGPPDDRDYFTPERLHFSREMFEGSLLVYRDRIREIELKLRKNKPESIVWFSALGLHEDDLKGLDVDAMKKSILSVYRNAQYLDLGKELNIYSRGIRFTFDPVKLLKITVFPPMRSSLDF